MNPKIKKIAIVFFLIVLTAKLYYLGNEFLAPESPQINQLTLKSARASSNKDIAIKNTKRKPATTSINAADFKREYSPANLGLPKFLHLVTNAKSINFDKYDESQGPIISLQGNIAIFVSENPIGEASNVIFDEHKQNYYPVSSVLTIKQATASTRALISNYGLEETYYREDLGLLYAKSSHETLIEDYEYLKESGLDVNLEIHYRFHKSR